MRILVLGIDGMIGHKIAQSLSNNYEIIGSTRKDLSLQSIGLNDGSLYKKDFIKDDYRSFFNEISPDVIINCIGILIFTMSTIPKAQTIQNAQTIKTIYFMIVGHMVLMK